MATMRIACPALLGLLVALAAPAPAIDCGALPKGTNPSMVDLDKEIARLSGELGIPTEIVKAISWRESGT